MAAPGTSRPVHQLPVQAASTFCRLDILQYARAAMVVPGMHPPAKEQRNQVTC